jgi:hypothetical protein
MHFIGIISVNFKTDESNIVISECSPFWLFQISALAANILKNLVIDFKYLFHLLVHFVCVYVIAFVAPGVCFIPCFQFAMIVQFLSTYIIAVAACKT